MQLQFADIIPKIKSLDYLFTESEDVVVAHCLTLDLVATGTTRDSAERRLDNLVRAQMKMIVERFSFADLTFSAPQEYWDRFYEGEEFKKTRLELDIPPIALDVEQKAYVPVFMRALSAAAA